HRPVAQKPRLELSKSGRGLRSSCRRQAPRLGPDDLASGGAACQSAPSDLDIAGQEAQPPLLAEAPVERPDSLGMRGGFVGALGGRAIGKQDQRANDLIAPLEL